MVILAMEISTSSAKAIIYEGQIIQESSILYDDSVGDIKKQDPYKMMELAFSCAKKLVMNYGGTIDCIALSSVWSSLLLIDQEGNAGKVSTWADLDGIDYIKAYQKDKDLYEYAYKHTGCNIHSKYPLWRLMAYKEQGLVVDFSKVVSVAEWLFYELTDKWAISDIMASGTGLYNLETLTCDHHLMNIAGLTEHQLSSIVNYKTEYPLSREGMQKLGLQKSVPVMIPNADGGLNHISEMENPGEVISLSIGTSAAIRVDVKQP